MGTESFQDNQRFSLQGSRQIVENLGRIRSKRFKAAPVSSAVASVTLTLIDPRPTPPAVQQATATVSAAAPGRTTLSSVAQVRAASADQTALVIDFGAQRTVTGLDAPAAINSVLPWTGTTFDERTELAPDASSPSVTLKEVQTERLLVTFDQACAPATFAQQGSVTIPTPPSNLELLVGDTRVWFHAGPAVGSDGADFTATVDVTAPVAAAATGGTLPVVLTLRAAVPGLLELGGSADLLERYPVSFPDGTVRTVAAASEGVYAVSLPITANAAGWQVERVLLDVSAAKLPEARVLPATGPAQSGAASLQLDPDHAFVVQLPVARTSRLATLTGIRLPVLVGAAGAELAGILRADATASGSPPAPGDPLPQAAFGRLTLDPPAQAGAAPTWVDLTLNQPLPLAGAVWVELQVTRGSLVWPLAAPDADSGEDAGVLRRTPLGQFQTLSSVAGLPTPSATLRIVGAGSANRPLPAIAVGVAGDSATEPVGAVPSANGTSIRVNLDAPTAPVQTSAGGPWTMPLALTVFTPGSYGLSAVELQYQPASTGART